MVVFHCYVSLPKGNHVWMNHLLIIRMFFIARFQPPKVLPLPNHFLPLSHWFVGLNLKNPKRSHLREWILHQNSWAGKKKHPMWNDCIIIHVRILKYPRCYMIFFIKSYHHPVKDPSDIKHKRLQIGSWPAMQGFSRIPLPLFTAAIGASSPAKGWKPIRSMHPV